jgi:5-methylcytosine-specific restriction enzyme A
MPHRREVHRWYTRASWQRRRAHQLRVQPLCELCVLQSPPVVRAASVADHHPAHRGDYNAFRLGPLRSLCVECHNALDRTTNAPRFSNARRFPVNADGTPSDPKHWWNIGS